MTIFNSPLGRGRLLSYAFMGVLIGALIIRGVGKGGAVVQFGYAKGLIFRGNIIESTENNAVGLYVWGISRYNEQPGENVTIADNQITATDTAISLNGAKDVRIHGNTITARRPLLTKRTENLTTDLTEEDGPEHRPP